MEDATVRVRAGEAVVLSPGIPHAYGASVDDPWTIYWVHMHGPKAGYITALLELSETGPLLHPGQDPALATQFEKLLAILMDGYTPNNLLSASIVLAQLITHLRITRYRQSNNNGMAPDLRIRHVIDLMRADLSGHFQVEDLAAAVNLSSSHLAAIFKRHTGYTLIDFYIRLKIQRACFLLDTTDMTIKMIAADLGFDDALYFSRCFRRIHACSPTQYRSLRKG